MNGCSLGSSGIDVFLVNAIGVGRTNMAYHPLQRSDLIRVVCLPSIITDSRFVLLYVWYVLTYISLVPLIQTCDNPRNPDPPTNLSTKNQSSRIPATPNRNILHRFSKHHLGHSGSRVQQMVARR